MENSLDFSTVRDDAREIILALKLLKKRLLEARQVIILPNAVKIHMMNNMPVLEFRSFQVFFDRVTRSYEVADTVHYYSLGFFDLNTTLAILIADMLTTSIAGDCVTFIDTPTTDMQEDYEKLLTNFIEND